MLMSMMRKHAKSWLIKFLIAIIAVVFIFYFGYSFSSREGTKIAYVNGELIGGLEYQKAYRNMVESLQREYKGAWSDNLIKVFNLKRQALDGLISEKLVSQEAKKIGLSVTDKEIQAEILAYPAFQFRGRFDENRYRAVLSNNHMTPEDFEQEIARNLLQKKVGQFLMTFLPVTDQDLQDYYALVNGKVKISFVAFLPDRYKSEVKIDQVSLEKYFKEHREQYRVPEKIKIAYVTIDPDQYKAQVKVGEQEIKYYYEDHVDQFKTKKQVKARHILFKLDKDASKEEVEKVRSKAEAVLEKAKKGEDFASLAKEYSEGPTAPKGGELGYFSEGQMVKPFEKAAFQMKKGQISDLIRTDFGFHIILVEDVKEASTKSLEEVREQIKDRLQKAAATDLAHEKALSFVDQMPYDVDLEKYASEHGLSTKEVGYFSQDEPIPDIKGDEKLKQTLFSLQKKETSDLIDFGGKFYVVKVLDKKPSYLPELSEAMQKVKEDFLSQLALDRAKSAAEQYLERLKKGADWEKLAEEYKLKPQTTDYFTRNDFLPEIGYSPELQEEAFLLDSNHKYPDKAFETERGVFVIRWEEKAKIDQEKFRKEKDKYRQSLTVAKFQQTYKQWLAGLRQKADVEILESFDNS